MTEWMSAITGEALENQKLYAEVESDTGSKILGVPLDTIEQCNENGLPIFLTCLMDYIEATAIGKKDLFTEAPDPVLITQIQEGVLDFELIRSHHAVAGLIQVFLHEMPVPVLTFELRACFLGICDIVQEITRIQILHALCQVLPPLHYNLLHRLCFFLKCLADNDEDTLNHLCNTFSVLLLRSPKELEMKTSGSKLDLSSELSLMNEVTRFLILFCDQICPYPLDLHAEAFEDGELDAFIIENGDILAEEQEDQEEQPQTKKRERKKKSKKARTPREEEMEVTPV
eukprot:CAMPEP_0117053552 /NCGR_PEP_ID=MMETSP0472-20121206/37051_1 /TAXON_ID=693140 ORGANISM="Tiarina fusus, Strain LIS" /NCGR_SAMPLE_ID=MMETSP0472 /ASSEMBLY_ACC=CAM_ASM_000603 /LENGTH=285 /DNA_ID=CAMNT_0004768673 /DNA_START=372 /DNA_END=1226 /DNA_ORIENTATION=-